MRGYADQATFEVVPVEGEVRTVAGVPCRFRDGFYFGADGTLRVSARHSSALDRWYVAVGDGAVECVESGATVEDAADAALRTFAALVLLGSFVRLARAVRS